jgi:hypothetical protein
MRIRCDFFVSAGLSSGIVVEDMEITESCLEEN